MGMSKQKRPGLEGIGTTSSSALNIEFERACDKDFHNQCREIELSKLSEEAIIGAGLIDEEHSTRSRSVSKSFIGQRAESHPRNRKKQSSDNYIFFAMLRQMDRQLDELKAQMALLYEALQNKYGEDVVGGMADTFLPPEVIEKLKTDEDKMQALVNEFLNEDGTIKEKYRDLPEAQFIQKWQEAQDLTVGRVQLRETASIEHKEQINHQLNDERQNVAQVDPGLGYKFS